MDFPRKYYIEVALSRSRLVNKTLYMLFVKTPSKTLGFKYTMYFRNGAGIYAKVGSNDKGSSACFCATA